MTPILNLHILAEKFTQLSNAAYFDPEFREFSHRTAAATRHAIENEAAYAPDIILALSQQLWRVLQFVSGSRSNDAPHEVQYVLRKALAEWGDKDALISSASLNQFDFFLDPLHLWNFIKVSLSGFDTGGYEKEVVRIAAPEAYKNKPIFCVPLFHELGHYVDHKHKISDFSLLMFPPKPPPMGVNPQAWVQINLRHRMEFFADLFASCYCGETTNKSLLAIAPHDNASATHPATLERVAVVDSFLSGKDNLYVNMLQASLSARGMPMLKTRFSRPDIKPDYDDVLTYKIKSVDELYGIFAAGWDYLEEQISQRSAPWITNATNASSIEKIINDLTEKSIRNFEVRERWDSDPAN